MIRYGFKSVMLACAITLLPSTSESAENGESVADEFAATVWDVTEAVLENHVSPPTRQEMILAGMKLLYRYEHAKQLNRPSATELSRQVSALSDKQQILDYLAAAWRPFQTADDAEQEVIHAMLSKVPGSAQFVPADEYKVHKQLHDNLYEGIGIALGFDADQSRAMIHKTFPRGPARQAGAKAGDLILSVDGESTKDKDLGAVIEMLRGGKGTPVLVVVQQPKEKDERTLDMIRGVIPFDTILGARQDAQENWEYRLREELTIAYLKFNSIRGSTPHELRQIARKLDDLRGIILDLRGTGPGDVRHTAMLADAFLEDGIIGEVRGLDKQVFRADRDCLFKGLPVVVLIDSTTSMNAEWLAAALQDNHRATLVGQPSAGQGLVTLTIQLPNQRGAVTMFTSIFHRADGHPLVQNFGDIVTARSTTRVKATPSGNAEWPKNNARIQPDQLADKEFVLREAVALLRREIAHK